MKKIILIGVIALGMGFISNEIVKASEPTWWNDNYAYRLPLKIVNNVSIELSDYTVYVEVNTADLISAGKILPNGDDLRIVYWTGTTSIECDRDISGGTDTLSTTTNAQIYFKIKNSIPALGSCTGSYYLYYGNPSAVNPPANKDNVYLFSDNFTGNDGETNLPKWNVYTGPSGRGVVEIQNNSLREKNRFRYRCISLYR